MWQIWGIRLDSKQPNHLQLVEDGCLSRIVQPHNDDFVFCWEKKVKMYIYLLSFSLERTLP